MSKSLAQMQEEVYKNNLDHGWFDGDRPLSEDLMLITTEVGEAYEAYRKYGLVNLTDKQTGKPEDVGSELADVLIRLLDTCHRYGYNLEKEYERKMTYNRTRPYRHGNRLA